MKKNSTVAAGRKQILKQAKLTIGLDLGDRTSDYCILDEVGNLIWERSVPTTLNGIRQAFGRMPRCRIALETGTHSPWVSRQLSALGHEVIVAHARNVRLIGQSSRKDDRLDARTLARLARIDPGLLSKRKNRLDTNRPSHGRTWVRRGGILVYRKFSPRSLPTNNLNLHGF